MSAELSPARKLLMEVIDVPNMAVEVPPDADLVVAGVNSGDLIRLGLLIEERSKLPLTDEDLSELQTVDGIDRILRTRHSK